MEKITLTLLMPAFKANIPIEAETITPDNFAKKSFSEIKALPIWRGNKKIVLADVFDIVGTDLNTVESKDIEIQLIGNLVKYKKIGQNMTSGIITIYGSIGMHLGTQMSGGKIVVNGNVDDFAGANMTDGEIIIHGNAGHYLGGSKRGDWRGMDGGKIIVDGNVKNECGIWMRKGIITVGGNASMFLGMHMHNGLIIVKGNVEERIGAEMTGGTIIVFGEVKRILPSFILKEKKEQITIEDFGEVKGPFLGFAGDYAEKKQGSIFLFENQNKHLL